MKKQINTLISILFISVLFSNVFADTITEPIRTFAGHTSDVYSVAFSPDGRYALSGSDDDTVKLWEVNSGEEIRTFEGHTKGDIFLVSSVAFSPDGRYALSGGGNTVKLWDVNSGEEIRTFARQTDYYTCFFSSFSPDGRYALSCIDYNTFKLWDVNSGEEIRTLAFAGHTDWVMSVVFSPDSRYVLTGSCDKTLKLWDMNSGAEIRTFAGHTDCVYSVAFSPDGRYALSGGGNTVKLWDVNSGEEIRTFAENTKNIESVAFDFVESVAFSPDGRYALSGNWNKTLKLWDVNSGEEIRTFAGHTSGVTSVAFSPDGRYALSGSHDKTLKLWNTGLGSPSLPAKCTAKGNVLVDSECKPLSITTGAGGPIVTKADGSSGTSEAKFSGGWSEEGGPYQSTVTYDGGEVTITQVIRFDPAHVGEEVDIIVLLNLYLPPPLDLQLWYQVSGTSGFVMWDESQATIEAFETHTIVAGESKVIGPYNLGVLEGLPTSDAKFDFGYRTNNGTIITTGVPTTLKVR